MNSETILLYHRAIASGMDSRQASLYALGEPYVPGFWERHHKTIGALAFAFCLGFSLATYHWYAKAQPFIAPDVAPTIPAITNIPAQANRQVNT